MITSKQERETQLVKKMGITGNSSDDIALFNNVCRKGGPKDAEFLTTLHNWHMQYFKLLFLLIGVNVKDCPLPAGVSGYESSWLLMLMRCI